MRMKQLFSNDVSSINMNEVGIHISVNITQEGTLKSQHGGNRLGSMVLLERPTEGVVSLSTYKVSVPRGRRLWAGGVGVGRWGRLPGAGHRLG